MINSWLKPVWLPLLLGLGMSTAQAANIVVVNNDSPDEGFNDTTPATPVGGNPGTTLGQQRLNALQFAANLLGARLASNITIPIDAEFNPQQCSPGNATLAAAGATTLVADFRNAPFADTFYPVALANALANEDLAAGPDIGATFNSGIDNNPECLTGMDWYYGFDDNPPGNDLNFISTATHELVHGLGFATFTNLITGQFVEGTPDVYARFIRDLIMGATWPELTAPQRVASASNDGNLVWDGPSTISQAAPTLANGTNQGWVQLFAPAPSQPGSSVSHWDTDVAPNALMEPFDTADVFVTQGIGLATCLLQDVGWTLINNTRCPDGAPLSRQPSSDDDVDLSEGDPPPASGGPSSGGGSSGGCVLAGGTPDPFFPLLVLAAMLFLRQRRV